ncbi:MAG: ubiquinone/menaquinone biosynthesis methyltransferase [Nannocystaceae bacterium]
MGTRSRRPETVAALDQHGRKVQSMFSDIAHGYDRANRAMSLGIDVRWRRRAVDGVLATGVDPTTATVLDLCAGTLDSSLAIHRRYPRARIVAGDFSVGMLEQGERRLRGRAAEQIAVKQMDAHDLPEADASLDAIFCAFGLRNLSELHRATDEMRRCLRPGGRLTILEFFQPTRASARIFHAVYNHTVLPAVGWACTGNLAAYRYLPRSIGRFVSVPQYAETLVRHGFTDIEVEPLTFGVASIVRARRPREMGA